MVTIEEARQQIVQAKKNVELAKKQDIKTKSRIEQLKENLDSTSYLLKNRGINAMQQRQIARDTIPRTEQVLAQRKQQIAEYEDNIQQAEQNVATVERQIKEQEDEQREWETAKNWLNKPYAKLGLTKSEYKKYLQLKEEYDSQQAYREQQKKFKEEGINVVTDDKGKVVGFEDTKNMQSYSINNFPDKYVPKLKNVGFTFETVNVPEVNVQKNISSPIYIDKINELKQVDNIASSRMSKGTTNKVFVAQKLPEQSFFQFTKQLPNVAYKITEGGLNAAEKLVTKGLNKISDKGIPYETVILPEYKTQTFVPNKEYYTTKKDYISNEELAKGAVFTGSILAASKFKAVDVGLNLFFGKQSVDILKNPESSISEKGMAAGGLLLLNANKINKIIPKSEVQVIQKEKVIKGIEQAAKLDENPKVIEYYIAPTGEKVAKYSYDITSKARKESVGSVSTVTVQTASDKVINVLTLGKKGKPKEIYSGNPFKDSKGYKKAKDTLIEYGAEEKTAKELLRYQQPVYIEPVGKAVGNVYFTTDAKPVIEITGTFESIPKKITQNDISTRMPKPTREYFNQIGENSKNIKENVDTYNSEILIRKTYINPKTGGDYNLISQRGETTQLLRQGDIVNFVGKEDISIPVKVNERKVVTPKDSVTVYQGGTSENVVNILESGLKPGKAVNKYQGINKPLDYVFVTTEKESALGYANRAALKSRMAGDRVRPIVLEANIPKDEFISAVNKQGGIGRLGEVKLSSVKPEFIKTPKEMDFSNIKISQVYPTSFYRGISFTRERLPSGRLGKVSKSKSTIMTIDRGTEPIIITAESPVKVSKDISIPKTFGKEKKKVLLNEQQAKDIYKTLESIYGKGELKTVAKNELIKANIPQASVLKTKPVKTKIAPLKTELISDNYPTYVGGSGVAVTQFTSVKNIPREETVFTSRSFSKEKNILDVNTKTDLDVATRQNNNVAIKNETMSKLKNLLKSNNITNQENKLRTNTEIKLDNRLKTETKQELILRRITKAPTQPKPPKKPVSPRIPIKIVPKPSPKYEKIIKDIKETKSFDVFSRRKGKEILVAKDLPEGLAKKFGSEYVTKTLAASFKLKASGVTSKEDIKFKVPEGIFRKGKRDSELFVQRKGGKEGGYGRLASGTELSEIKMFRRGR